MRPPFHVLLGDGALRLRDVLDAAGFTQEGTDAAIGDDALTHGRRAIPLVLRRTADGSPLSTLIRLFLVPADVPIADAARVLAPLPVDDLISAGILERVGGDTVRGAVHMRFHEGLVVAVDHEPMHTGRAPEEDHVMGLSRGTLMLARLTDSLDAETALDVGTGAGLQALLLARHVERVVATDITDRAVEMARFNAALNRSANIDVRQGDLFAPVGDETFDIVVSNPPYVVGPPMREWFMSTGRDADGVSEQMVREAARHLRPGGRASVLAEWAVVSGQPWQERVSAWFEGSNCDATLLSFSTLPVDAYATRWIAPHVYDPPGYVEEFDAWMRWYADRRIEAVTFGIVTMRRREGAGESLRLTTPPLRFGGIDGDDLQLALGLGRWLETTDDAALLASRLRLTQDARLLREYVPEGDDWVCRGTVLGAERGLADPAPVDGTGAAFAIRCDGTRTVGELLGEGAKALLPAVRDLVARGLLLPEL